jgi:hypothetical protein
MAGRRDVGRGAAAQEPPEPAVSDRESEVVRAFRALRDGDPPALVPAPRPTTPLGRRGPGPADDLGRLAHRRPDGREAPGHAPASWPLPPRAPVDETRTSSGGPPGSRAPRSPVLETRSWSAPPAPSPSPPASPPAVGSNGATDALAAQLAAADRAADPAPAASDSPVGPGDRAVLDLAALTVAIGAFVAPVAWLALVAAGTAVALAAASVRRRGPDPAALVRRLVRRIVSWLRPRSLVWFPVLVARVLIVAVAVPFALGAVRWLLAEGAAGAVAAGRAAAWHHGFRVAAVAVCFLLVAGSGAAHDRRALTVRSRVQRLGAARATSLAVAAAVAVVLLPVIGPRAAGGPLAGADGLAWAPARLRDNVDRVRDDLVTAELDAATGCLSGRQDASWRSAYTAGNPLDQDDVVTLRPGRTIPDAAEVVTAVAAVHNQLAPWVEGIEVVSGGEVVAAVDRAGLPTAGPVADPASVERAATAGDDLLRAGAGGFDRRVALRCSAGPVP